MGCGSSIDASTRELDHQDEDQSLDNGDNNCASVKSKGVKELVHDAFDQSTEANERARDAQKEKCAAETKTASKSKELTILHFNDVYNIESREKEPVGGAARFATKLASFRHLNPLIVFSGDCLNPSTMSSVTGGKQMIPVLNALNVNIAVFGNHDFDFGVGELIEFSAATTFPWLLSNVIDNMTGRQLAEGEVKRIIEWCGRKIGFIGLVEEEWLVTLATVDREEVTYIDFVSEGTKLAKELREEGAEFVVALTHMRGPNDHRLAEEATGIDLVLGGHDHDYFVQKINGIQVVKSGTDFREFSCITVSFNGDNKFCLNVERFEITSDVPEDPVVKLTVDKFLGVMNDLMEETIGELEVELDGRFSSIRTRETNLGNFVTDIILNVTEVDCVILNSGTLRSDSIHPPGKFKMKDLSAILPMPDILVVLELTGDQILDALENGVSQWPKLEGRFPQVAGMRFSFNPGNAPGFRILKNSVKINDEPLDKSKKYKVCTKSYLSKGKDGYKVFSKATVVVDEENGLVLSTIVRNHFRSINIVRGVTKSKSPHRQSLIMRHRPTNFIEDGSRTPSQEFFLDLEREHTKISPQVEGRITMITGENEAGKVADFTQYQGNVLTSVQAQQTNIEDLSVIVDAPDKIVSDKTDSNRSKDLSGNDANKNSFNTLIENIDEESFPLSGTQTRKEPPQGKENLDLNSEQINACDEMANQENLEEKIKGAVDKYNQGIADGQINGEHEQIEGKSSHKERNGPKKTQEILGLDLATEDEYWDLWEAVKVDDIDVVKHLREEKNIRFTRVQDNKTILHLGAERNSSKVVMYLLTDGKMDPNVKDEILQGVPLHGAAEYGSIDAASVLLEYGAEINRQDLIGNTALHIACQYDQAKMKTFLLNQGADTTVINSDGETPTL